VLSDSEVSGVRSLPTAVFLQVVLDWMNSARDIQLSVQLIDYQRRIANEGVAGLAGFCMDGSIIEIEPAKVVLFNPHYHQLLNMAIFVQGQWRIEVERCDLVFVEIRSDDLVCVLAGEHCVGT
jgi:hypothetical protein